MQHCTSTNTKILFDIENNWPLWFGGCFNSNFVIYSHIELSTAAIQAKRRMQLLLIYAVGVLLVHTFVLCIGIFLRFDRRISVQINIGFFFPHMYFSSIHSFGRSFYETHWNCWSIGHKLSSNARKSLHIRKKYVLCLFGLFREFFIRFWILSRSNSQISIR